MELHIKASLKNATAEDPQINNNNNNQEETTSNKSDEFPCLSLFLPILQSEYEQERSRTDRIDNKAMALLTIIIALITVYVPIFPFDKLANFYLTTTSCPIFFIVSVLLLCAIVAIVLAIHSAKMLIDIYKPKEFQAVNIQLLNNNEKLSKNPPTEFLLELIDHYQAIILNNSEVNSKKADLLNKQFIKAIIIFGLLSVSASGILICTGI
ncbi:hypothetical protein WMO24_03550 [Ruthenibacterium sp. CLA-JM-H11]|uniref:Uncharacterized protein n=1 Tax=Ruthenibacterium intestinale TaxID=3133163 RepID=A0ABV1GDD8_9FIRM